MVFTFQRGLPIQTTRIPISMRRTHMSQVQELFHEAAQQVGLGGVRGLQAKAYRTGS